MSHFGDEDEIRRLSRRIAAEFESTYGTLDEKVARVPDEAASAIADECNVPIEVARVAYRVMLDGIITDAQPCCDILMQEFFRRAEKGDPVPEVDTYMREVALTEGKWIEYLYGQLGKILLPEIRDLANLEGTVSDEIEPATEHVIAVIAHRRKIADVYFTSLIDRWLKDHEAATIVNVIHAITGGLLGTPTANIEDALNGARASLLIKLRRYEKFLSSEEEDEEISRLQEKVLRDIRELILEVQGPMDRVSPSTAAEILIEVMPPPPESIGEESKYVFVHPRFPTQTRMGPPLKTPLDFLERDVWLASMQPPAVRTKFLQEKITSVSNRLLEQGTSLDKLGTTIIFDLDSRFSWTRSKKTVVRRELREIRDTAGDDYQVQLENYILENILAKIPELRSKTPTTE